MHNGNVIIIFMGTRDLGCTSSCCWSWLNPCASHCGKCRGHSSKCWFDNLLWWKRYLIHVASLPYNHLTLIYHLGHVGKINFLFYFKEQYLNQNVTLGRMIGTFFSDVVHPGFRAGKLILWRFCHVNVHFILRFSVFLKLFYLCLTILIAGAKYELPKYVLSEPTNLIQDG